MRHTRSKQIRKTLQFYERLIPGFPRTVTSVAASANVSNSTPYHILLDGTFIVHSFKYHVPFVERIHKLLGLRWYDTDSTGTTGDHVSGNRTKSHEESNDRHPPGSTRKPPQHRTMIVFYVCQSTITELQAIQTTIRETKANLKKKKKEKKMKQKQKSQMNNERTSDDPNNESQECINDDGDGDDLLAEHDYLQQAIDFCSQPLSQNDDTHSISVIVLPARPTNGSREADHDTDAPTVTTITTTTTNDRTRKNRRHGELPSLSTATSDLWYYLSSPSSSSSSSNNDPNQPPPQQPQYYMIATQDPTLLYYCRHFPMTTPNTTATIPPPPTTTVHSPSVSLPPPIPMIRYNIPTNNNNTNKKGCGVLVLDPPSTHYMKQYQYLEHGKWFHSTTTTTVAPNDSITSSSSSRRNGTGIPSSSQQQQQQQQRYLPKKAKGPNPLSCKKKKTPATTTAAASSSKRQRTK